MDARPMPAILRVRDAFLDLIPEWLTPNDITLIRGGCVVPLFVVCLTAERWRTVLLIVLILFSAWLDILDGWLARNRGIVTAFGKILDQAMDKLFNLTALVLLSKEGYGVPEPLLTTIITFDLLLFWIRPVKDWMGIETQANAWGSAKTWLQTIGLIVVVAFSAPQLTTFVLVYAILLAFFSFAGHVQDVLAWLRCQDVMWVHDPDFAKPAPSCFLFSFV